MSRDLESRIDRLPEEKKEVYDERIEPIREELEDDLKERHKGDIKNQIEDDEAELSDFNVVVSCFLEQDSTKYQFIRTEPLIHTQKKNFDLLVAAPEKGIAVLVEIERTLLNRLPSKLNRFEGKMDVICSDGGELAEGSVAEKTVGEDESEKLVANGSTEAVEIREVDVDEYFEEIINTIPDEYDFVLSSQHLAPDELQEEAADRGMNFIAWMMGSHGNTCRVKDFIIKESQTAPFDGHTDDALCQYIENVLSKSVEKQDYVNFAHSSSKYLKLKHMSIALVNRYQRHSEDPTWDYEDWRRLFESEVDLQNYLEEEKRTLFENFVEYGMDCGVVGKEEDNGGVFSNRYKIKSNATRNQQKLISELLEKMADHRMKDDFEKALREEKERIVTELERDHATGGTTLDDFADGS